jgi:hypothetical protein
MISDMTTAMIAITVVAAIVALLERNHRRTAGLPRAPFGADAPDRDLDRVWHDMGAADFRTDDEPSAGGAKRSRPANRHAARRLAAH